MRNLQIESSGEAKDFQLMKNPLKSYFALATIEGVLSLIWLLTIPSDPKTAWFFGYSRFRVLLVGCSLIGITLFVGLFINAWRDATWEEEVFGCIQTLLQRERIRTLLWVISILILILAITGLWLAFKPDWTNRVDPAARSSLRLLGVYLTRLAPLLFWGAALSLQTMIILWLQGYTVRLGYLLFQIFSVVIFPILMLISASLHSYYYRVITREDALIEWLTVAVLLLAAVLAIVQVVSARQTSSLYYWFFMLFAVACVLFAFEEISWGQRVLRLESTKFFVENSDQQEINVHNVINEWFSIRTKHVAAWTLFIYGVILPVLVHNRWVRSITDRLHVLVPPLILVPGFTLAALMTWDRYFTGQDEEVAELFFALLLLLFMAFDLWESRREIP